MYDAKDLFKKQIGTAGITEYHPKILAFNSGLEKVRKKIDEAPQGCARVKLPIKVRTEIDSYSVTGVRKDGTLLISAEFSGFMKEYSKKLMDSQVKFED